MSKDFISGTPAFTELLERAERAEARCERLEEARGKCK